MSMHTSQLVFKLIRYFSADTSYAYAVMVDGANSQDRWSRPTILCPLVGLLAEEKRQVFFFAHFCARTVIDRPLARLRR